MNNEIEQLAEQHGMTVEFVAWFFGEKKAACGSFWLMMMAAMWEGWKGRDGESTAALATIEKCREVSGCPAGVDLQGHLRQLAAENVGLKAGIGEAYDEMKQLDDGYFSTDADGEPMDTLITLVDAQAAIQRLAIDIETPATDRIVAGIKAEGAEACVRALVTSDDDDFTDAPNICAMVAFQLREGADK